MASVIARRGRANATAQGVTEQEVDGAVDEADINRRADGDRGRTPLDGAIRAGNEAVVKLFTRLGAAGVSRQ